MDLLDKVSPRESDKIYVLGDIIDRGPGSAYALLRRDFLVSRADRRGLCFL